jgi:ATP-binding cassette subfamily C (CFTR/MRP) protein 1
MNRRSCNDESFGPIVRGCRHDSDFTLLFENTILSMMPSMFVLLLSVARILVLHKKAKLVSGRVLQLSKLVRSRLPPQVV